MKVVLASTSAQRRLLLEALGIEFELIEPQVEEMREGDPRELVIENARWKAASASALAPPGSLVIAADTEVVIDGRALGQPRDAEQAREHLWVLSGREHEVLGGLALLGPGTEEAGRPEAREGLAVTKVRFRALEEPLLEAYLASGEWKGRAGSYAIQGLGSALVESVEGDVSNVIGLPIPLLLKLEPAFQPR